MIPNNLDSPKLGATLKKLWKYIKKYKLILFTTILATVLSVACNISTVYYIQKMIDDTLLLNTINIVQSIVIILTILAIGICCSYLTTYLRGRLGSFVVKDLRNAEIERIENAKMSSLEKNTSGDMVTRINDDSTLLTNIITNDLTNFIYFPLMIICSGIYMALMNLELFIISFITIPIALILVNILASSLNRYSKKYSDELGKSNSLFFEMIGGIQELKSYNSQEFMLGRYKAILNHAFRIGLKSEKIRVLNYSSIINILRGLPYIFCIVYGGKMVFDGVIKVSVIIAFTQLLDYIINPSIMMSQLMTNLRSMIGAVYRVLEVMDLPAEDCSGVKLEKRDGTPIQFKDVTFGYNISDTTLNQVSFGLNKNEALTLVGPSGCGKSTIIKLICRFYEINKGKIEIFGTDINELSIQELRKQIALVSQEIYLFPDTIAQNIAYGSENVTMDQIVEAAKKANAHEFILKLPDGYQTLVGEMGSKLSGGQRQRIAIARALIKDAPILLLDEPTSSLDFYSEGMIKEALEILSEGRSVLKVTHRLNTIKDNEIILVIDEGEIVQRGIHKLLLQEDGLYRTLYLKQAGGEVLI